MIFDSVLGNILCLVIAIVTIIILKFKWTYTYWQRKKVPYLEPTIPWGNSTNPFKRVESTGLRTKRFYNYMKSQGWKYGGLYTIMTPHLIIVDLDVLRNIMTKDFQHFTDRPMYVNEKADPLSAHLFNMSGEKWRNMRIKLSPTFTSGKMKMMFQTLLDCVPGYLDKIEEDRVNKVPINIKETLGCFTTDIIGCCAFGLDCNTVKDPNSPFRFYGRKFFDFTKLRMIKSLFCMNFPTFAKIIGLSMTPKDVEDFFIKMVKDTVNYRESKNLSRKDFLQLLIDTKNNKLTAEDGTLIDTTLTLTEIAAQSFVFFVAGFETSSTTMTFALYELANDFAIQQKVRDEINEVTARHGGQITYDAILEMKYLDQVVNETLRKYPPIPMLHRKCVKDYKVPDSDVVIDKGTVIHIPVLGFHHDEEHFPNAEKFDPERFSNENKGKRHNYAFIPFGEGPRNCIGMRFGLMQTKVGMTSLLKNYRISVNKKTKQPLKMNTKSFIPTAEGGLWLDAEKI